MNTTHPTIGPDVVGLQHEDISIAIYLRVLSNSKVKETEQKDP